MDLKEPRGCFVVFIGLLFLFCSQCVVCEDPRSLFVFGDSYADTGNTQPGTLAWRLPYGIFLGRPSGRLSDGKILTDFVASFYKLPSPEPYSRRGKAGESLKYGMNFAVGGAGVVDSAFGAPTTGSQIAQLHQLVKQKLYSPTDFASSVVLYSASGNDYANYYAAGRPIQDVPVFTQSVIGKMSSELTTLYDMGFRRFAVMGLGPIGCMPYFTAPSFYESCNSTINQLSPYHNTLLQTQLNGISAQHPDAKLGLLDQYSGVMSVMHNPGKLRDPLKPCCAGICGLTDGNGMPLYSLCDHPDSSLFWDGLHLTENGWRSVMPTFNSPLSSLLA